MAHGCFWPASGQQFAGAMPFARVRPRPVNVRRRTLEALLTLKKALRTDRDRRPQALVVGRRFSEAMAWWRRRQAERASRRRQMTQNPSVDALAHERTGPIARLVDAMNVARFGYVWPSAELASLA